MRGRHGWNRRPLHWRGVVVVLALCVSHAAPSVGASEIYRFVDDEGVLHFTNVPTDPRFQRISPRDGRGSRGAPDGSSIRLDHDTLNRLIGSAARRYGVEGELIKAVIKAESAFDPYAISRAGALGLMQLLPTTAQRLNVHDPFDPEDNIHGGVRYLRALLDRFEWNLPLALAAYNAGALRVEAAGGVPRIAETRRYIKKVLTYYHDYRQETDGQRELTIGQRPSRPIYRLTSPTGITILTNNPIRFISPVTDWR